MWGMIVGFPFTRMTLRRRCCYAEIDGCAVVTVYNRGLMRTVELMLVCLCLAACRPTSPVTEPVKSSGAGPVTQIAFEPTALCTALNEVGLVGGRWKEGAAGFGCASTEVQIGPRDPSNGTQSSIWYEVRGTNPDSVTTVVLGGDVRAPEAETAVRDKLTDVTGLLLKKLNMTMDHPLRAAIQTDTPFEQRIGNYEIRYSSAMAGKVRENRLTIQRAL